MVGRKVEERTGEAHTSGGLAFAVSNLLRVMGADPIDNAQFVRDMKTTLLNGNSFAATMNGTSLAVSHQLEE
jgi:hypothetical protein